MMIGIDFLKITSPIIRMVILINESIIIKKPYCRGNPNKTALESIKTYESGFILNNVLKKPIGGAAYTTGVIYINKETPVLIILLISVYINPSGVMISPIANANKVSARRYSGNSTILTPGFI